jgi:hypothetical protein
MTIYLNLNEYFVFEVFERHLDRTGPRLLGIKRACEGNYGENKIQLALHSRRLYQGILIGCSRPGHKIMPVKPKNKKSSPPYEGGVAAASADGVVLALLKS